GEEDPRNGSCHAELRARNRARRHQRVAAARAPAALDERAVRTLPGGALVPFALAAGRARPRVGAPAPCAARAQGAPHAASRARLGSPAGESDHRPSRAAARDAAASSRSRGLAFGRCFGGGSFASRSNSALVSLPSLLRSSRWKRVTMSP